MIRELRLRHFKCFEELHLPIQPLTLLSGVNASGKSTIVQAFSLIAHSVVEAEFGGVILLDSTSGPALGTVADVVDDLHGRRSFELGLSGPDFSVDWVFEAERDASAMPVGSIDWAPSDGPRVDASGADLPPLRALLPASDTNPVATRLRTLLSRIDHLGAERLGPREVYRLTNESWHDQVGMLGERAPGALWWFGDSSVPPALCQPGNPPTLLAQTGAWLERFFPGVAIKTDRVGNVNAITLAFRTNNESEFHRPQHVGYGITQVLPIIVACLRSSGRALIVENPEVHLHPAGQAAIGAFLARTASAGGTVIVETHSDHVLNGVRRMVHDRVLAPDQVAIHFFRERSAAERSRIAQVTSPHVDVLGNIDEWPGGFFDQFDIDMSYFAGLG